MDVGLHVVVIAPSLATTYDIVAELPANSAPPDAAAIFSDNPVIYAVPYAPVVHAVISALVR